MFQARMLEVDRGKKIYVFDDVFEMHWRRDAFMFILASSFRLGWKDQEDPHQASNVYFHSRYSQEDIDRIGILNQITHPAMTSLIEGKQIDEKVGCTVNCSVPTDTYFAHPHKNTTLLYYANPSWKEEWAGETLFYNEDVSEIVFASVYKPGRVIIFDGGIPHSLRPQSRLAPHHRFTLSIFFGSGKGLQ